MGIRLALVTLTAVWKHSSLSDYSGRSFIGRVPEHENGGEVDGVTEDLADGRFERQKEFLVGRVKVGLESVEPSFLRTSYLVLELIRPLDGSPRPG